MARVVDGFVVAFPAGIRPCAVCKTEAEPIQLRGWVRLAGLLVWHREQRHADYVCADCARRETTKSLLYTALLGWWSVLTLLFFAPRATFHNWRAVFTHPLFPGRWGALPATELAGAAPQAWRWPLRQLSDGERQLVSGAEHLYERLGTPHDANTQEIRAAFRARAMRVHPDKASGDPRATEEMMRLNEAWQILSSRRLRQAYDWLERTRVSERAGQR